MNTFKKLTNIISVSLFLTSQMGFAKTAANSEFQDSVNKLNGKKASDVWYYIRDQYSVENREIIDSWVLTNPNESLPVIQTVKVKQSDGTEALRLMMNFKEKQISAEIKNEDKSEYLINGKKYDVNDVIAVNTFASKMASEKTFEISLKKSPNKFEYATYAGLNESERAVYFLNRRLVLEAARAVLEKDKKAPSSGKVDILRMLFSPEAFAQSTKQCLTATGYVSNLNSSSTCSNEGTETNKMFTDIKCESGNLCNPILYGLNRKDSTGLCLSDADIVAGKSCGDLSPVKNKDDYKALLESMKKMRPHFGAGGMKPPDGARPPSHGDFDKMENGPMKKMTEYIAQALAVCEADKVQQETAQCKELVQRQVSFNSYQVAKQAQQQKKVETNYSKKEEEKAADAEIIATNKKDTKCGFFCSIGTFLTSKTGIITSLTVVATGFIAYNLGKKKGRAQAAASSTSTNLLSPLMETLTTPTGPDYTGAVQ